MPDSPLLVDTADRRLASYDLRLRGSALTEGRSGWLWVLELPARVGKASFAGTDLVWSAEADDVPAEAVHLLAAVTGGRPLQRTSAAPPAPPGRARHGLSESSTIGEVVEASITDSRRWLIAQDLGLRTSRHPEFVHQARVAARTLRSDLRTFRPLLEREPVQAVRGELKWLGAALGDVRDLDVLEERLAARAADMGAGDGRATDGFAALRDRLHREREEARDALVTVLDTARYRAMLSVLEGPLRWSPEVSPDTPARQVVGRLVRRPWRRLARTVAALPEVPSDHELHQVRLRAKQVRYASEAVAPVMGKPAELLAKRAKALQSTLGDHQDAAEGKAWMEAAVAAGAGPEETWFAGKRALLDDEERRAVRADWAGVWSELNRKSLRRWLR